VTTTAWDFARHIGGRPIYAAGLDLGYPEYRTHVGGSLFEERSHLISHRLAPAETHQVAYIENGSPFPTKANDGGQVLTDQRMSIYRDWFALQDHDDAEARSCNLSPHGAVIPGMPHVPLHALLDHEPSRQRIDATVQDVLKEERSEAETAGRIHAALFRLSTDLDRAAALGQEAIRALETEEADPGRRRDHPDRGHSRPLDVIEADLRNLESKDIIGFLLESVVRDLQEGPAERYQDAVENSRRVYAAIEESAHFHARMLRQAVQVLERG
jgi:hypothetical protein